MQRRIFVLSVLALAVNQAVYAADEPAKLPEVNVTATSAPLSEGYDAPVASTGTKTDTPVLETPASVQVVTQQILQDQKATTFDQALVNVSGVRSSSVGWSENIYLRGFETTTYFRNGFRIDDPINLGGQATLSNVESIEILKGPGSILYGRVEPGGVLNIITKQPQDVAHYSIEQSVGSWQHYITSLDATGPLTEDKTLLYRLNLSHDQSNSWVDNVHDKRDFIAPTLKWIPSGVTQVTLEASYSRNTTTLYQQATVPYDTVNHQFLWGPSSANPVPNTFNPSTTFVGLNWTHDFSDVWSIRQQISHNRYDLSTPVNWGTAWGPLNLVGNSWTIGLNSAQLSGTAQSDGTIVDLTGHFDTGVVKHTLLVGADYYQTTGTYNSMYSNPNGPFQNVPLYSSAALPVSIPIDPNTFYYSSATNNSLGVYVQDQIKFPNKVQLLAGLRYQDVKGSSTSTMGSNYPNGTGIPTDNPATEDHAVTPRVGVLWKANDLLSLYASYTENFGASNAGSTDWQGKPLKQEGANQYEVGEKTETQDGKLITSIAVFDLTKTNMLANDLAHPDGQGGFFQTNIGQVESQGMEITVQGEISPGWDALAAYTYDWADVKVGTSTYAAGSRMPFWPDQMFRLYSTYKFHSTELEGWKVGGGMTWQDSAPGQYVDPNTFATDTTTIVSPAYKVFDAMASYEFKTGKYKNTFQLNVRNLFSESYYTDAFLFQAPWGYVTYGAPRSVMASLKIEM